MRIYFLIDGDQLSLDIPLSAEEINFSDFCDFKTAEAKFFLCLEEKKNEDATWALIEAVNAIVAGPVNCLPLDVAGDDLQALIPAYKIKLGDDISLNRTYIHIINVINGFVPPALPGIWKVKTLEFSRSAFRVLTKKNLTVGEAMEVLEFQRRAGKALEENPHEIGNIDFTLGLTELALLCRKKGELLPASRPELERFLTSRRPIFAQCKMDEILTLRFFLHTWLVQSTGMRSISSSFKVRRMHPARTQKNTPGGWNWQKWLGL